MQKYIICFLLILLCFTNVFLIKASAKEDANYYSINVGIQGSGYASVDKIDTLKKDPEIVTFTAHPNQNIDFIKWNIEGEYKVIEGNLSTPIIKIIPNSKIVGIALFSDGYTKTPITNEHLIQTGQSSSNLYVVLALMVVSSFLIMFMPKKKDKISLK